MKDCHSSMPALQSLQVRLRGHRDMERTLLIHRKTLLSILMHFNVLPAVVLNLIQFFSWLIFVLYHLYFYELLPDEIIYIWILNKLTVKAFCFYIFFLPFTEQKVSFFNESTYVCAHTQIDPHTCAHSRSYHSDTSPTKYYGIPFAQYPTFPNHASSRARQSHVTICHQPIARKRGLLLSCWHFKIYIFNNC